MSRNALQNNSRTNGQIIQNGCPSAALNQRMTYEILLIASVTLSDKETNGGDRNNIGKDRYGNYLAVLTLHLRLPNGIHGSPKGHKS